MLIHVKRRRLRYCTHMCTRNTHLLLEMLQLHSPCPTWTLGEHQFSLCPILICCYFSLEFFCNNCKWYSKINLNIDQTAVREVTLQDMINDCAVETNEQQDGSHTLPWLMFHHCWTARRRLNALVWALIVAE